MNIYEEIKLLNIERNCVRHADVCNRECDKCKLVQDTDELLEMYDDVVKDLEKLKEYEDLEEQGRLIKLPYSIGTKEIFGIDKDVVCCIDAEEIKISKMPSGKILFAVEGWEFCEEDFGETVFLTKSEAEAKSKTERIERRRK